MKKTIILLLVVLVAACGVMESPNKQADNSKKNQMIELLAAADWVREEQEEEEHITFTNDGHFSYWEASSGNAVGDFDLYESFDVDTRQKEIVILPIDKGYEEIRMSYISVTNHTLELRYEGEILTFHNAAQDIVEE
ncbi:hypothetical protein [Pradoshia sp.]